MTREEFVASLHKSENRRLAIFSRFLASAQVDENMHTFYLTINWKLLKKPEVRKC